MNAHDIDWTQAPEGYDYFIVDTHGEQKSEFHRLGKDSLLGDLYVDQDGFNWIADSNRLEVYQRPTATPQQLRCVSSTDGDYFIEGKLYNVLGVLKDTGSYILETEDAKLTLIVTADTLEVAGSPEWGTFDIPQDVTHLRCIGTNDDESFTLGSVYEVVEDNCQVEDAHYVVRGDDNYTWAITKDTLEFSGDPDVGQFEDASVGYSVQAPEGKTQPEFGDIVHVQGKPYVFIRIDSDGDYYVVSGDGDECYLDLNDIDEYASKDSTTYLRNLILTDIKEFCNNSLEDHMTSVVNFNIPELIDFIMMYKDNWEL